MSSRIESPRWLGKAGILGLTIAAFALAFSASSASALEGPINSSGPLTQIQVNHQLGCQLFNNSQHQFATGDVVDNYCGTFVVLDEAVYGDELANDNVDFPYHFDSQDLTGDGSSANPFKLTTVVDIPAFDEVDVANNATAAAPAQDGVSLLTITETETYVTGDDFFRTDLTVHNDTNDTQDAALYHAGDCFLGGSDVGFATDDTANSGAVFCIPQPRVREVSTVPPRESVEGILGFVPISAGSSYLEQLAGEGDGPLFDAINGNQFDNTCTADCSNSPTDDTAQDNGTGLSWALSLPGGGSETECYYTVDSSNNNVPDIPSGPCIPAANTPPATIAQKPSSCKLRISRARVFLFRKHPRLRLVARYRSTDPADVLINFIAVEGGNKVNLGDVTRHFRRHGLFRLREELSQDQSDTLWQTHRFIVHFKIPGEPGFCARKYKKELTVPRIIDGQRVVFQTDSSFGSGPGHPEH
jgi:hypothetical protein